MKTRMIPKGAIKVPLPLVAQPDDYSCGAGGVLSISAYYGVGPIELDEVKKACKTNPEHGTYYGDLVSFANSVGLSAKVEQGMTIAQLKKLLNRKIPVMLSLQAWADDTSVYDNFDSNNDGHWVVAVGYDDDGFIYCMDPSITGRYGVISEANLLKRWHENEGSSTPEISFHLGIIIRPKRKRGGVRAMNID